MTRSKTEQSLRMARAYAAEQLPWFASTLFSARLVLTDMCPSLSAIDDGLRVYFHPGLVDKLLAAEDTQSGLRQIAWVWVHEISHVLRDHGQRSRERGAEPFRWNVAADLEINDCEWPGLEPPRIMPPLLPDRFGLPDGKLAEYYYNNLPRRREFKKRSNEGSGDWPDEGSGVHGHGRPWERETDDDQAPAVTSLEQKTLRQQAAEAVYGQKGRGDVPGGWLRWADESLRPRVNWRERLRRRVRGAMVTGVGGRMDYSYQRPNRRAQLYAPLIRPALSGDLVPRVACVVDTSGSMSQNDLARCLAEVRGVLDSLRTPVTVIPCDAVAYEPMEVFTKSDYLQLQEGMRGGGGTNMVAGIDAARKLKPPPDAVIVLTDGFTPFPSSRYHIPVIFGILQAKHRRRFGAPRPPMPPWREDEVIEIDADV